MAGDAGEKTEEPSPRRLAEARRKGQIAHSRDLGGAVVFAVVFGTLASGGAAMVAGLITYLRGSLGQAGLRADLAPGAARAALGRGLDALAAALALPLGAALVAAVVIGMLQTGGLLTLEPLRLDLRRVMPSGKRVVSGAALFEMGKGLARIAIAGAVAWAALAPALRGLASLPGAHSEGARAALATFGLLAEKVGFRLALAAVALGAADHLWQRWQHRRSLRMTREEVKREHKEQEGDPHHKAERQRLHRELTEQRMLADVRKADFVVTNPDHIAVALRYDRDGEAAPVVVAKGERLLAEKIKEVAREAGVPVFRDVALARSLRDVEEGDEIPEALFEAVAEILRVIYAMGDDSRARAQRANPTALGFGNLSGARGLDSGAEKGDAPTAEPPPDRRPPPGAWWWRA